MRGEEHEVLAGQSALDHNGRGEAAVDRNDRVAARERQVEGLGLFLQHHQLLGSERAGAGVDGEFERDRHRQLVGLAGGDGDGLLQGQLEGVALNSLRHGHPRRSRLRIPAAEGGEVDPRPVLDRFDEILAGCGLAVMTVEIEVATAAEPRFAHHAPHHADHLGALVVDGRCVEVADLAVGIRPDRVGERPRILGELRRAQNAHILDPLDRFPAHVLAEQLVAQHGEALLQRELEPVAAGHAVARPVVEIFVRDHALDRVEIGVGRGVGVGQHIFGVEDVEPLVLHRPHVEVADGDDVVEIEVVFAPEHVLVPLHRAVEGFQSMVGAFEVFLAHPDIALDFAARAGGEGFAVRHQISRDQREEVGGLGPGVMPLGPVGAVRVLARGGAVAVA